VTTTAEVVQRFRDEIPDSAIRSASTTFSILHGDPAVWPSAPFAQRVAGYAALVCCTVEVGLVDYERADAAHYGAILRREVGDRLARVSVWTARTLVTEALDELRSDQPRPLRGLTSKARVAWSAPARGQVSQEAEILAPWMPWPGTDWADSIDRWDVCVDALLQRPWASGGWTPYQLLYERIGTSTYLIRIYEIVKKLVAS
jgi:hypothetical protein